MFSKLKTDLPPSSSSLLQNEEASSSPSIDSVSQVVQSHLSSSSSLSPSQNSALTSFYRTPKDEQRLILVQSVVRRYLVRKNVIFASHIERHIENALKKNLKKEELEEYTQKKENEQSYIHYLSIAIAREANELTLNPDCKAIKTLVRENPVEPYKIQESLKKDKQTKPRLLPKAKEFKNKNIFRIFFNKEQKQLQVTIDLSQDLLVGEEAVKSPFHLGHGKSSVCLQSISFDIDLKSPSLKTVIEKNRVLVRDKQKLEPFILKEIEKQKSLTDQILSLPKKYPKARIYPEGISFSLGDSSLSEKVQDWANTSLNLAIFYRKIPKTPQKEKFIPFSLPDFVQSILDVADTLCCLHQEGITHRDVKPDNILVVNESPDFEKINLKSYLIDHEFAVDHAIFQQYASYVYWDPLSRLGLTLPTLADTWGLTVSLFLYSVPPGYYGRFFEKIKSLSEKKSPEEAQKGLFVLYSSLFRHKVTLFMKETGMDTNSLFQKGDEVGFHELKEVINKNPSLTDDQKNKLTEFKNSLLLLKESYSIAVLISTSLIKIKNSFIPSGKEEFLKDAFYDCRDSRVEENKELEEIALEKIRNLTRGGRDLVSLEKDLQDEEKRIAFLKSLEDDFGYLSMRALGDRVRALKKGF